MTRYSYALLWHESIHLFNNIKIILSNQCCLISLIMMSSWWVPDQRCNNNYINGIKGLYLLGYVWISWLSTIVYGNYFFSCIAPFQTICTLPIQEVQIKIFFLDKVELWISGFSKIHPGTKNPNLFQSKRLSPPSGLPKKKNGLWNSRLLIRSKHNMGGGDIASI